MFVYFFESSEKKGAIATQGGHQVAKKSTTTCLGVGGCLNHTRGGAHGGRGGSGASTEKALEGGAGARAAACRTHHLVALEGELVLPLGHALDVGYVVAGGHCGELAGSGGFSRAEFAADRALTGAACRQEIKGMLEVTIRAGGGRGALRLRGNWAAPARLTLAQRQRAWPDRAAAASGPSRRPGACWR